MEIGTAYRLRTPKTGLGEGGGRGKRKSVDSHIIKLSRAAVKQLIVIQLSVITRKIYFSR